MGHHTSWHLTVAMEPCFWRSSQLASYSLGPMRKLRWSILSSSRTRVAVSPSLVWDRTRSPTRRKVLAGATCTSSRRRRPQSRLLMARITGPDSRPRPPSPGLKVSMWKVVMSTPLSRTRPAASGASPFSQRWRSQSRHRSMRPCARWSREMCRRLPWVGDRGSVSSTQRFLLCAVKVSTVLGSMSDQRMNSRRHCLTDTPDVQSTRHGFLTVLAAAMPTRVFPDPQGSTMIPERARPLPNMRCRAFSW
mmetsp:Transcript_1578/g.5047  ORF Transcript_1578/g.5047 Transcript_1578/m.5047 type:complete len:249 (-) Transcript_1578:786-1532(-)